MKCDFCGRAIDGRSFRSGAYVFCCLGCERRFEKTEKEEPQSTAGSVVGLVVFAIVFCWIYAIKCS
jgi:ribosome-binding protein aMBF1 (putative translation factor)